MILIVKNTEILCPVLDSMYNTFTRFMVVTSTNIYVRRTYVENVEKKINKS